MSSPSNHTFNLASDFVHQTRANLFLTGKAGTGKTTFLRHIRGKTMKNTAIVAPTGVAAINAGGTTIHSFFQLPLNPYIPLNRSPHPSINNKPGLLSRLRLSNERRSVIRELELLIIDEISMVRCDTLDAIDAILRSVRGKHQQAFGGVQVLLIGDLFQLPPVAKEEEWQWMSATYKSPYFLNSQVMEANPPVYIELDTVYRQQDPAFVNILNQVRNNIMDKAGYELLHSRFLPDLHPAPEENYITLTTHNHKADQINAAALEKIHQPLQSFDAQIEGEFSEKAYPADTSLQLKPGAQVMFIKNDLEKIRRYFNGKIGVVEELQPDKILVKCPGDDASIEVKKERWRNVKYIVDKTTGQVEEKEIGSFTQYPLRLAWAITIHKSQGLTFEKAIIDAGSAFTAGQVYVALSRCTSLQGMILHSRIQPQSLQSDERVVAFSQQQKPIGHYLQQLQEEKQAYQQEILRSVFDYADLLADTTDLNRFMQSQQSAFNTGAAGWSESLQSNVSLIQGIADKFKPQLNELLAQPVLPEDNTSLQARIIAAAGHFSAAFDNVLTQFNTCSAVTDNKGVAQECHKLMQDFFRKLQLKKFLLQGCLEGFRADRFLAHRKTHRPTDNPINVYAGKSSHTKTESENPLLHFQLRKMRESICDERKLPVYLVANSQSIDEMANYLPQNKEQLLQISGFGKAKVEQFGDAFLSVIRDYCDEFGLEGKMDIKPVKQKKKEKSSVVKSSSEKTGTQEQSLQLFKAGKSISEIARERNLVNSTVEKHLCTYIGSGELDIDLLVSAEKKIMVIKVVETTGASTPKAIFEACDGKISYGEIRMVLAFLQR